MCECHLKTRKYGSLFSINESERTKLKNKLPLIIEKTKNYLINKLKKIHHEDNTADTVFLNGKIYTMNQKQEVAQVVATNGENIIFVGDLINVLPLVRKDTHFVNLHGKTLLPGFIDPHIHMSFSMVGDFLDLSPFVNENMDQVKQRLIDEIKKTPKGQWVRAQLYDPTITPGKLDVSRWGLDKLCPQVLQNEICIYILQANGHVAHVNTRALDSTGVTPQTTIPFGTFMKNQKGELTGQLQQAAAMYMQASLFPPTGVDYYGQNFRKFLSNCVSKGVTSLHDCGIGNVQPEADIALLREIFSPEQNPILRYSGYLVSTRWDEWMKQGFVPDYKDPLLRIKGIKCWCDGSIQAGSGFFRQPYLKSQWGVGTPNYTLDQLINSIDVAQEKGWQVGVHGNGDAAIDRILDAFQAVQNKHPNTKNLRHRIQHCTITDRKQLQRMKKLNIHPSFLIGHIYYYGYAFKTQILGEERANLVDPMKSAIELGLRPTMHSDFNCQPVDPIRCIYNAVTRTMKTNGEVLNEKECVTPYEAIKGITIDAAWQCHLEDIVGSIEVGKKADFVILDKDPLSIPKKDLINLKVVQTWMNGRSTYKSEELKTTSFAELIPSFEKTKHQEVQHHKKEEEHKH